MVFLPSITNTIIKLLEYAMKKRLVSVGMQFESSWFRLGPDPFSYFIVASYQKLEEKRFTSPIERGTASSLQGKFLFSEYVITPVKKSRFTFSGSWFHPPLQKAQNLALFYLLVGEYLCSSFHYLLLISARWLAQ